MRRHELTDVEWARLAPLLLQQRTGRPRKDDRQIINALLWLVRTGAPWRDLPERYGPWPTVATRFYRWTAAGLWQRVLNALQRVADAMGMIDWRMHMIDSTIVRAHQHAAGAKGGQRAQALARARGGFSTKIHIRCDGRGKPLVFALTGGERHDQLCFEVLVGAVAIKRAGRGRPRSRPQSLIADRGYSSHASRDHLRRHGIRAAIPRKRHERYARQPVREIYRERNRIERLINRLKQYRRIATRYEKHAGTYTALITLAAVRIWL